MSYRSRDSNLWNMLKHGTVRAESEDADADKRLVGADDKRLVGADGDGDGVGDGVGVAANLDESGSDDSDSDEDVAESKPLLRTTSTMTESEFSPDEKKEKPEFMDLEANPLKPNATNGTHRKRSNLKRRIFYSLVPAICIIWLLCSFYNPKHGFNCNKVEVFQNPEVFFKAILDVDDGTVQHPSTFYRNSLNFVETVFEYGEEANKAKEIQEVANPFVPSPRYGKPVYKTILLDRHSFGNSYGHPKIVKFTIPQNVTFNAVVLNLLTEIDGIQHDRLANIFVNGVQIWRSSTIEPSGEKVFSIVNKDVSKYAKLFEGKDNELLFELNNIVDDHYTGAINITLGAEFFHFDPKHHLQGHAEISHMKGHHGKEEEQYGSGLVSDSDSDSGSGSDSDSDVEDNERESHNREDKEHDKPPHGKPPHDKPPHGKPPHHKPPHHEPPHGKPPHHEPPHHEPPHHEPPHHEPPHHEPPHHEPPHGKPPHHKPPHHEPPHGKPPHHKPPHHEPPHHEPPHGKPPHHKPPFHKDLRLFKIMRPADSIHALTTAEKGHAPVDYLSSSRLKVKLPTVAKNTTRLQLSVFTSGNAGETFWYNNVVDEYKNIFKEEGNEFIGKGPLRLVNVYFNGQKIASQTPEPVIFTGGISPALWSPVVSNSAFDVPSIDLDVTPLLPFLWEHQSPGDQFLEIEVSNGLGEVGLSNTTAVNENWITSANLLGFQHPDVVDSSGTLINVDHSNRAHVFPIAIPFSHSFQQIVNGIFSAQLISNLSFTLRNNKTLNTTFSSYSKGEISNIQHYAFDGNVQALVHVGHSSSSILIQDNDIPAYPQSRNCHKRIPENIIHSVNTSLSYPLVLKTNTVKKEVGNDAQYDIEYDVKIVNVKDLSMNFDVGFGDINVKSIQNGTSKYFLSSEGNHGFGSLTSRYKNRVSFGENFRRGFRRRVDAVNGTIVDERLDFGPDKTCNPNRHHYKSGHHDDGSDKHRAKGGRHHPKSTHHNQLSKTQRENHPQALFHMYRHMILGNNLIHKGESAIDVIKSGLWKDDPVELAYQLSPTLFINERIESIINSKNVNAEE
ncbi:hypothetical protein KGF56_001327 [Candida oxycetoniae]|uniref:Peptide N-acetyl-beta-D-glucosaminyl asparaginase amidase A N-terminal domain-containing protein n=1 Tax=Candida oxycetoniae TaxID=497107 RepID=A0AAI9SYX4_9ASCO|nr:uncharacterized protein KGF56_001327 [Candida oxycetoniae]KAI3405721.2 hypothetical protein KGF56_001327 [Candida oxycetoniae]